MLSAFIAMCIGVTGSLYPEFFFKSDLLSPEQVQKNKRIIRWCGLILSIGGIILLILHFFSKRGR
jgi:hypothetical protein